MTLIWDARKGYWRAYYHSRDDRKSFNGTIALEIDHTNYDPWLDDRAIMVVDVPAVRAAVDPVSTPLESVERIREAFDRRRTPDDWAQMLVDFVATATQLDPERGQLPNVEDWRRNAAMIFGRVLRAYQAQQ